MRFCGAMVVRKPKYACSTTIRSNYFLPSMEYKGIERRPWDDLDEFFYEKTLPKDLIQKREILNARNQDLSGLKLTSDIEILKQALNLATDRSEILALWSEELSILKGETDFSFDVNYLGIDCVALGEWSVILSGVFAKPDDFKEFLPTLNRHGLLDDRTYCEDLFAKYESLSSQGIVECLSPSSVRTAVKVYQVVSL